LHIQKGNGLPFATVIEPFLEIWLRLIEYSMQFLPLHSISCGAPLPYVTLKKGLKKFLVLLKGNYLQLQAEAANLHATQIMFCNSAGRT
jgi:hypothetical protein